MFAEKRAKILTAACTLAAIGLATRAHAQQQVFSDNFNNGSPSSFWTPVIDGNGSISETNNAPAGSSGLTLTATPASAADVTPVSEIGSSSLQSSFNFFQQPIVLQATGLNYSADSTTNALTQFNFGSQVVDPVIRTTVKPALPDHINTQFDMNSDFSLEIRPLGATYVANGQTLPSGQVLMGEKENDVNAETPWDAYQLMGPVGPSTYGTKYSTQITTGQVRDFTLVLCSQFYYLSITSDTSPTDSTPVTKTYFSGLNLGNFSQQYNWTAGTTFAPGNPSLNIETAIAGSNGADTASMMVQNLDVDQLSMTWTGAAGDGNYFTAGNWSGLSGLIDPTTAASLKITVPDYTSASATLPQASAPTAIVFNNGNGNTNTMGMLSINSTQPYTIDGGTVQFATNGSTDEINISAGSHTINAGVIIYDAHSAWNIASGASLLVNGPISTPYTPMGIDTSGGAGAVTITGNLTSSAAMSITSGAGSMSITGDFAVGGALTLNCGTGGMTINAGPNDDFLFHGPLALNVAAGGTLTINSFIDDPYVNSTSPPGTYPLTKTGAGLANVSSLYAIPSVTVSAGTLRIIPSTVANSFAQGGSYINALSITGTGKMDLTNNDMVIDYTGASPLATIRQYLHTGALYSSTASIALGTAVGYAEASEIGQTSSFNELPSDSTSICLMYTYDGDLNLDGIVNSADYTLMVNGNGSDWYHGDLNYDGKENADDWSLYDLGVAASNARGNINNLPAPEPASLAMIGGIGLGLMKRKRR